VVLRRCGEVYYVVKVERRQQRTPESQAMLKAAAVMYPGPMVWHCAGTELGSADLMIAGGVPLKTKPAIGDKLTRALPAAVPWNAGNIVVPRDALWAPDFLREMTGFTGKGDIHDDMVDMLATAYGELRGSGVTVDHGTKGRAMKGARGAY